MNARAVEVFAVDGVRLIAEFLGEPPCGGALPVTLILQGVQAVRRDHDALVDKEVLPPGEQPTERIAELVAKVRSGGFDESA